MKAILDNKGLSLVEVLVALTILVILVGSFATFFGWNIMSILVDGEKTRALAEAENKLEQLYYSMDDYDSKDGYVSCEDVFTQRGEDRLNFCVEEVTHVGGQVEGYNVTVVVFYHNGERHVSISSFIEGGRK